MHLKRKPLFYGLGVALVLGMVLGAVVPCSPERTFLPAALAGFLALGALITAVQLLLAAPFRQGLRAVWLHVLLVVLLLPLIPLGSLLLHVSRVCF
ncbi:MAG TPA: hypothetical protein VFO83_14110 [Aggregicoccus sp.]|nr:hypothetical protein [Aggregicoccus sp.]